MPETKGVRIEEMDKLFGGNQGESDLRKIAEIRLRLGIGRDGELSDEGKHPDAALFAEHERAQS